MKTKNKLKIKLSKSINKMTWKRNKEPNYHTKLT